MTKGWARVYVDGDDPETVLLGFTYTAVGDLEERTRYQRDPDSKQRLRIDRFDATGEAKSTGEVERAGGPDLWKGPLELPEKAKQAGLHVIYLAKETKDQSYLRVYNHDCRACRIVHEMFPWWHA